MNLQLPIETVNQVLGYLGTRPYQEVYALIQAIQDAAKPKEATNGNQMDSESNQ
jgi:hypothetical protein